MLVRRHFPQVECTRPILAEVLAPAAQAPGSAALTPDLLSSDEGRARPSHVVPRRAATCVQAAARRPKRRRGILIGARNGRAAARTNPLHALRFETSAFVHSLAARRIPDNAVRELAGLSGVAA